MAGVVYTWNMVPGSIQGLCRSLQLTVRPVAPQETGIPIRELPDSAPVCGPAVMPFREEMLLMADLSAPQLDAFLRELRVSHPVRLKAVLTPFNARWTSLQLYDELSREARAMGKA